MCRVPSVGWLRARDNPSCGTPGHGQSPVPTYASCPWGPQQGLCVSLAQGNAAARENLFLSARNLSISTPNLPVSAPNWCPRKHWGSRVWWPLGRGVPLGRAEPSPFPSTRAGSCRIYCKPKPQQPPSPAVPEGCVGTEAGEGWITVWKFLYEGQFI